MLTFNANLEIQNEIQASFPTQLLCDEYVEKTSRMRELQRKLEEFRKEKGEILSGTYS